MLSYYFAKVFTNCRSYWYYNTKIYTDNQAKRSMMVHLNTKSRKMKWKHSLRESIRFCIGEISQNMQSQELARYLLFLNMKMIEWYEGNVWNNALEINIRHCLPPQDNQPKPCLLTQNTQTEYEMKWICRIVCCNHNGVIYYKHNTVFMNYESKII